ncbi:hypothetical protein EDD99_0061 [Streptomyces sp. 846.5]|nr:hypothetical protein [Streptomyces sp. 846.5]TDU01694.1 hypothetical protein EDD99_0061 [Streptomyces sp. 846.5]
MPGLTLRTEDCVPAAPEHCYRVVPGRALVQETRDAGRHWSTAWQLSAGRELFLRRSGGYATGTTGARLRLDSTSLVVLPVAAGYVVIVADQNDGLVVRAADGRWARTGLAMQLPDTSAPVPVTGFGRGIGKEYVLALCAAGLALVTGISAACLRRGTGRSRRVAAAGEAARVLLGVLWMAGLDLTDGLEGEPGDAKATVMVLLTLCVLTGLSIVRRGSPAGRRLGGALTAAALCVGLVTILPFLGWTLALPDSYPVAFALALLLFLCGLSGTWLLGHRLSAPDAPSRPGDADRTGGTTRCRAHVLAHRRSAHPGARVISVNEACERAAP